MEVLGITFVLLFYISIAILGLWIGYKKTADSSFDNILLAGRDLGLVVGIFTLVATEVGGAFINGTAEEVYSKGIVWCVAPLAYSLNALQESYGSIIGALIYIPSFIGDICWTAALLTALGSTLSVLIGTDQTLMICISAALAGYYQRALALRTTRQAQLLSYISAFICITFMIPPIFIGGAAKSSLTLRKIIGDDFVKVLPVTIGELSPKFVTYSALGAVSAASMSSMDSAVLSGASYFSHNVYISLFRPTAGRLETMLVFRVCLIFLGVVAAIIAINSTSIYGLWSLAGDLSFAIVFPQFFKLNTLASSSKLVRIDCVNCYWW
ncbi:SLC5A7 [Lepeophtheirus salmonis]|uniref:SLC5A7 n=1 Tax=Lepeophtheirus salmonis TaxID=72036 RepID=A0A7R8H5U1_LEPSM|nr:SLC5A7 [Lepeophtheirus salmonis]CAF2886979.1 SLC5A7 [Lepeophtheirus salmonis]